MILIAIVLFSLSGIFFVSFIDSFANTVIPPRQQWKEMTNIDQLICNEGLLLLQKTNGSPACVSFTSYLKLIDRGYGQFDSSIFMKRPAMTDILVNDMATNKELMSHWHEMMQNDPTKMDQTMQHMIELMKKNPDYVGNMIRPLISYDELREQMIELIKNHPYMEQSMHNNPKWMESVHKPMIGQGMEHGMSQDMKHGMNMTMPHGTNNMMTHEKLMGFSNSDRITDMMHHLWINTDMSMNLHEHMFSDPRHMEQMSYEMMQPMLGYMMDDPEIRQKMIEYMLEHEEFMNTIRHENTN